jgi:hypothetical protein
LTQAATLWRAALRGPGEPGSSRSSGLGPTHELDLPSEFEGKSAVKLHEKLAASDLKQYIVVAQ